MKHKNILVFIVSLFSFLVISCFWDQVPYLAITNGYEFDVVVYMVYINDNATHERTTIILSNKTISFAYKSFLFDNRIISIRVETPDNILLMEYSPEEFDKLQKIYRKYTGDICHWIFTEKGLFVFTDEIAKRYNNDGDKIYAYFHSDEAVQDLQALLEKERSQPR